MQMRLLLLLFVLVPLSELYLLLWVSRWVGFWPTVAITLVTGVIGGSLAKREGLRVWRQWNAAMNELRAPEIGIVEGLLVLVGGVLLITPGVLTDVVGFLLLFPLSRGPIARFVRSRVQTLGAASTVRFVPSSQRPPGPSQRGSAAPSAVVETSGESRED